jgi:hypothetical protein
MFALRIIEETRENENAPFEQVIENFALGNSYAVLKKGATREFDEEMKASHPDVKTDDIRVLLCAENGLHFHLKKETILSRQDYFIMTESGKTFERL